MRKIFYVLVVFILLAFNNKTNEVNSLSGFSKGEKQKIAFMIAFDFFINFDLSIKNEDLSIIFDYMPNRSMSNVKRIKLKTNVGYIDSDMVFTYDDSNYITKINYTINNRNYEYEIEYSKKLPKLVKLNGKIKYRFVYEKKMLIKTLHYKDNEVNVIFYINYQNRNRAKLESKNAEAGVLSKNTVVNNLRWNSNFNLTEYDLMRYKVSNISYNENTNVKSFTDKSPITKPYTITWNYKYNNKGHWLKREFKNVVCTREIIYAK